MKQLNLMEKIESLTLDAIPDGTLINNEKYHNIYMYVEIYWPVQLP